MMHGTKTGQSGFNGASKTNEKMHITHSDNMIMKWDDFYKFYRKKCIQRAASRRRRYDVNTECVAITKWQAVVPGGTL